MQGSQPLPQHSERSGWGGGVGMGSAPGPQSNADDGAGDWVMKALSDACQAWVRRQAMPTVRGAVGSKPNCAYSASAGTSASRLT